jgi:hypothetical protein
MFFFGATFDSKNEFEKQGSLGMYAAFTGVFATSVNLALAHEVKGAPLTLGLLGAGLSSFSINYNLVGVLEASDACVELPVSFEAVAGGSGEVRISYGDGMYAGGNATAEDGAASWLTPDDSYSRHACPLVLGTNGTLGFCACCESTGGGEQDVVAIAYRDDPDDVNVETGQINNCACFRVEGVECGEDIDYFASLATFTTAMEGVAALLTGIGLLMTIDQGFKSGERVLSRFSQKKWERWKKAKLEDVKKVMEQAKVGRKIRVSDIIQDDAKQNE